MKKFSPDIAVRVSVFPADNIVHIDADNLDGSLENMNALFDEVERKIDACAPRGKPFIVTNWANTKFTPEGAKLYADRIRVVMRRVRAIARYKMTEPMMRVMVRTNATSLGIDDAATASNIFESRADAFAAVRSGKLG